MQLTSHVKVGDQVDGGVVESVQVAGNGLVIAVVTDPVFGSTIQLHHDDPDVFAAVVQELALITGKQPTIRLPQ
jgi:hypothetical protein